MSYDSDSDVESGRRRSWSDVSNLVVEEIGKQKKICNGYIILFISLFIIIARYSILISLKQPK